MLAVFFMIMCTISIIFNIMNSVLSHFVFLGLSNHKCHQLPGDNLSNAHAATNSAMTEINMHAPCWVLTMSNKYMSQLYINSRHRMLFLFWILKLFTDFICGSRLSPEDSFIGKFIYILSQHSLNVGFILF